MYCFVLVVRRKQEDDDDIVAGTASMSLKDPVRSFSPSRHTKNADQSLVRVMKIAFIHAYDTTYPLFKMWSYPML